MPTNAKLNSFDYKTLFCLQSKEPGQCGDHSADALSNATVEDNPEAEHARDQHVMLEDISDVRDQTQKLESATPNHAPVCYTDRFTTF